MELLIKNKYKFIINIAKDYKNQRYHYIVYQKADFNRNIFNLGKVRKVRSVELDTIQDRLANFYINKYRRKICE